MATINLDAILRDNEGQEIKDGDKPLTARKAIRQALSVDIPGKPTEPKEMVECDDLQSKIRSGNPELSVDELKLMDKWCGLAWGKVVYPKLKKIIDQTPDVMA